MKTILSLALLCFAINAHGATYLLLSQTNAFAKGITNEAKAYTDAHSGGGIVGTVSNNVVTSGLLAVDASKTNVIAATSDMVSALQTNVTLASLGGAPLASPALTGTPTINGQSIETQLTNKVSKAGDTMTGDLTVPLITATKGYRQWQGVLTPVDAGVTLDFDAATLKNSITLTGNVTFAFSNVATNRAYQVLIKGCSTNSSITWPAGVHGQLPALSEASKWAMCWLEAWGTTASDVIGSTLLDP